MSRLGTSTGLLLIAAGLLGFITQQPDRRISREGPTLPLAAHAWAQAHCDSTLVARTGTPRVQTEDLLRIAAAYEAQRAKHGLQTACHEAVQVASRIAEPARDERPSLLFYGLLASLR